MKKYIILSLVFLCFCMLAHAAAIKKTNLKVLYVGGTSNIDVTSIAPDASTLARDIAARTASFGQMLKEYFKVVKCINAKEYKQEMSNHYDVTIFDGKPNPIKPMILTKDKGGNVTDYHLATYLTLDYDRPTITIADMSEEIGREIGTKADWYCLCLDADAYNMKVNHPIFKGPYKVKLDMVEKPTPTAALEYQFDFDKPIPKTQMMWTVQTKGYQTVRGYRVGMVSRPGGFTDSPDAEVISGGVSAKSPDAVAIGRHGNFLNWGFSASPADMTPAAKNVFANAVVYISKFAGQHPIARKFDERVMTRDGVKLLKYICKRSAWEESNKANIGFNKSMQHLSDSLKVVQKAGGKIADSYKDLVDFTPMPLPSFEEFVKRNEGKYYEMFGTDSLAYAKYFDGNYNYLYPAEFSFSIDNDVKSLGIANNDVRLLDKAISLWESGKDIDKAKKILTRYTLCRFQTPQEWRSWYNKYNKLMFFTESGGWLFLINSRDPSVPGNDYSVIRNAAETSEKLPAVKGKTDDKNPVLISGVVNKISDNEKELVILVKIHPSYHIYGNVSSKDPFIPTKIEIVPSDGYSLSGDIKNPPFTLLTQGSSTTIYTGDAIFRQRINGNGKGSVKCTVSYQCCNNSICFPPQDIVLTLVL